MSEFNNPLARPEDFNGDINSLRFAINQSMSKLQTSLPVEVLAVRGSGIEPVGFVDIKVLVDMIDGAGNTIENAVIHNVPYFRLQGGSCAFIVDPKVGDIGLAAFCSRDISSIKSVKKAAPPGSWRKHDLSDAMYLGGFLNGTPTSYVQITDGGILIHNSNGVKMGNTEEDTRKLVDERFVELFNSHQHGTSPTPNEPMGGGHITSNTKAN